MAEIHPAFCTQFYRTGTPPKTNMEPENTHLEK